MIFTQLFSSFVILFFSLQINIFTIADDDFVVLFYLRNNIKQDLIFTADSAEHGTFSANTTRGIDISAKTGQNNASMILVNSNSRYDSSCRYENGDCDLLNGPFYSNIYKIKYIYFIINIYYPFI